MLSSRHSSSPLYGGRSSPSRRRQHSPLAEYSPVRKSRTKNGCHTCRIRRKKCDQEDGVTSCQNCFELKLECFRFGPTVPDWFENPDNRKFLTDKIKAWTANRSNKDGPILSLSPYWSRPSHATEPLHTAHSITNTLEIPSHPVVHNEFAFGIDHMDSPYEYSDTPGFTPCPSSTNGHSEWGGPSSPRLPVPAIFASSNDYAQYAEYPVQPQSYQERLDPNLHRLVNYAWDPVLDETIYPTAPSSPYHGLTNADNSYYGGAYQGPSYRY